MKLFTRLSKSFIMPTYRHASFSSSSAWVVLACMALQESQDTALAIMAHDDGGDGAQASP
jgi:hypothetical protein